MKLLDLRAWGPTMWRALHSVSFTPDRGGHLKFFEAVPDALPCPSCGTHLKEIYKKFPIDVSSVAACSRWLWQVHDEVNASLGKSRAYTYQDLVRDFYEGVPEVRPRKTPWLLIALVLTCLILLVYLIHRRIQCKAAAIPVQSPVP